MVGKLGLLSAGSGRGCWCTTSQELNYVLAPKPDVLMDIFRVWR